MGCQLPTLLPAGSKFFPEGEAEECTSVIVAEHLGATWSTPGIWGRSSPEKTLGRQRSVGIIAVLVTVVDRMATTGTHCVSPQLPIPDSPLPQRLDNFNLIPKESELLVVISFPGRLTAPAHSQLHTDKREPRGTQVGQ